MTTNENADARERVSRPYTIVLKIDGAVYPIHRDVTHIHPPAVHAALGTRSEAELQMYLDDCYVSDWYDSEGRQLGPDDKGLELRWAD